MEGRSLQVAIGVIAVVAIFAALRLASSVFAPLACALFMIAIVWPMQSRLQSRLPRLVALAIVLLTGVAVFVIFASVVAWAFGRLGQWLIADAARIQLYHDSLTEWLGGHGVAIAGLWTEYLDVGWLLRTAQRVTGRLNTTVTFWLIVLVYVVLGLLEVDDMERKIRSMKNRQAALVVLDGCSVSAAKLRKYLAIRTLMSVITGVLVWALASLTGLQFAAEWGAIAFVLNYIPFIGPFIATTFPTLFALTQFSSWQAALALFACLNVIQFVVGSYLEPRVHGSALAVSPFVVLFSVFLWTFLWGLFGAFIGVPITIAILTFCAQHPSSRWLADLLGPPGAPQLAEAQR